MTPTEQVRFKSSHGEMYKLPNFQFGRDRSGQWGVRDKEGCGSCLFWTCNEALRFAWHERRNAPSVVIPVPGLLDHFKAVTAAAPCKEAAKSLQV
jgi:hypothetical protein